MILYICHKKTLLKSLDFLNQIVHNMKHVTITPENIKSIAVVINHLMIISVS